MAWASIQEARIDGVGFAGAVVAHDLIDRGHGVGNIVPAFPVRVAERVARVRIYERQATHSGSRNGRSMRDTDKRRTRDQRAAAKLQKVPSIHAHAPQHRAHMM